MATTPPDQISQLDATLDALQGGLPRITDADTAALLGWIKTLHATSGFDPIVEKLQQLQDAITKNHGGTIADSLSSLSELTKQAAATGTPDVQSKLYQLSDVLKLSASQVGH